MLRGIMLGFETISLKIVTCVIFFKFCDWISQLQKQKASDRGQISVGGLQWNVNKSYI